MILAGDIGGTKTVLAVYAQKPSEDSSIPLHSKTFASNNYKSLEQIIAEFLAEHNLRVTRAVFGLAGPVTPEKAGITNLSWTIETRLLQQALGTTEIKLINDLEAIAWSIPTLEEKEILPLNPKGKAKPEGTIAVLAPGTGLGEAFLFWNGSRYQAAPSEGGHTDLAPTNELEIELVRYLLQKYGHVSYERVCSGIGIPDIYSFLKESGRQEEPAWLSAELAAARDKTPVITRNGTKEDASSICRKTLEIFAAFLGAEAGNMALTLLPAGGVYIGGGIPPRILDFLVQSELLTRFFSKGRLSRVLTHIPVNIILKQDAALAGAARCAMDDNLF